MLWLLSSTVRFRWLYARLNAHSGSANANSLIVACYDRSTVRVTLLATHAQMQQSPSDARNPLKPLPVASASMIGQRIGTVRLSWDLFSLVDSSVSLRLL